MNIYMKIIYAILLPALALLCLGCAAPVSALAEREAAGPTPAALLAHYPVAAPSPTPLPTPEPAPQPTAPYTIAWISDTQHYSMDHPDTFAAMTAFLRDSARRMNLSYIVHTGDIVGSRRSEEQWQNAVRAMSSIAHLPAGVCAGNHDVGSKVDYAYYARYFGENQVSYRECYGGSFQDNRGHYDLIQAGNSRLLFLYMGYSVTDEGIAWMREVIEAHPDRAVIICTHAYFDTNLSLLSDGERIHDEIAVKYPNVYMVLSGHRYNVACVPEELDDDGDGVPDRTLYQMICNYQAAGTEGGGGYMMFFEIHEAEGFINCYTYSPVLKDYVYFDDISPRHGYYPNAPESERFTIPVPWQ